jgi:hypothetical protein
VTSSEFERSQVLQKDQGDRIGRIFTHWAIDYFGQFFENCRSSRSFGILRSTVKVAYLLILTKNRFG